MTHSRWLVAAIALLVATSAHADKDEDKDKVKVKDKGKDKGKGKDKDKDKVKVSGFLTAWYKFRIDENGDGEREPDLFRLGKIRVRVSGWVHDKVGYVIEIDPRSPTIQGLARDAYVKLAVVPRHEIRIGQQKTQFGYENPESSTRLYTITRSELGEGMARGVTLRDIGVGIVGNWKVAKGVRIEDAVTLVNGAGMGVQADDTTRKNLWGRVGVRYKNDASGLTVRIGLSGALGDQMTEADPGPPPEPAQRFEFSRIGTDLTVDHPWFFGAAELAMGWDELPAGSGETESQMAWYVLAAGKSPWKVGPVVRYDAWDLEEWSRITAGAYWGEPDDDVRVIVHYEHFEDEIGVHDGRVLGQAMVRF